MEEKKEVVDEEGMLVVLHPGEEYGGFYEMEHSGNRLSGDAEFAREELGVEPRNIILAIISQATRGMDLHRIAFPTFVLEPRSMLERITDFMAHPQLIIE